MAKPQKVNYGIQDQAQAAFSSLRKVQSSKNLNILLSTSHQNENCMPQWLKEEKRNESESITTLFEKFLAENGGECKSKENGIVNTLEVSGVSAIDLHRFSLEAEKLGMDVKITQTLNIQINH